MHALRYELGNLISERDFGFNWTHPGEPPARPRPLLPSRRWRWEEHGPSSPLRRRRNSVLPTTSWLNPRAALVGPRCGAARAVAA